MNSYLSQCASFLVHPFLFVSDCLEDVSNPRQGTRDETRKEEEIFFNIPSQMFLSIFLFLVQGLETQALEFFFQGEDGGALGGIVFDQCWALESLAENLVSCPDALGVECC